MLSLKICNTEWSWEVEGKNVEDKKYLINLVNFDSKIFVIWERTKNYLYK